MKSHHNTSVRVQSCVFGLSSTVVFIEIISKTLFYGENIFDMEYVAEYSVKSLDETFLNPANFQLDIVTQLRVFPYRVHDFYVRSKQICIFTIS